MREATVVRRFAPKFHRADESYVFELSDVTVVDGEKAVLDCHVAVTPAAEVTRYVDTSFAVRGLRAGTDYCFRVVATSRAVRRDAIQRGALLARPTSNGGATIVTHVIEQSRAPVTDEDARRAGQAAD